MSADPAELWDRYARSRSIEDRNALVLHYAPTARLLAARRARRIPRNSIVDVDDLETAALIGLTQAIEAFDPSRGLKFVTYGVPRIQGSMIDELRKVDWVPRLVRSRGEDEHAPRMRHFSDLNPGAGTETERDKPFAVGLEQLADRITDAPFAQLEEDEWLLDLAPSVHGDERHLLEQYYRRGRVLKSIGADLGVSESRASQMRSEVIDRLRKTTLNPETRPVSPPLRKARVMQEAPFPATAPRLPADWRARPLRELVIVATPEKITEEIELLRSEIDARREAIDRLDRLRGLFPSAPSASRREAPQAAPAPEVREQREFRLASRRPGAGTVGKRTIQYLQDHGPSRIPAIAQSTGDPTGSIAAFLSYSKLVEKVERGVYRLKESTAERSASDVVV
jgi:RNA polymerase sigma factor FliA